MPPDSSDSLLLRRYADTRAEAAFAELVQRHVDSIYSVALRRVGGDAHLAQDVTQQVFVALAQRAARLAEYEHLAGWLYAATRNIAANVVRQERRRRNREQEAHAMDQINASDQTAADWERIAPLLDEAIDRLGRSDRTAVLLRFIERRPFAEIGAALRVSDDAARMRVDRALDKLRAQLAGHGITSTASALGLVLANHAVYAAPVGVAAAATAAGISAPGVAATALQTLLSMTLTKTTLAVAAAAAFAIALSSTGLEYVHRQQAAAAFEQANAAEAALVRQRLSIDARAAAANRATEALRAEIEKARAAKLAADKLAADEAAAREADAKWDPAAAGRAFLAKHPEVKQAFVAWMNASVDSEYGPLYAKLHLTPEQLDRFHAIMRAGNGFDPSIEPGEKPMAFTPDEAGLNGKERERQLHELLGKDYHAFWLYRPTIGSREIASEVASFLTFTDTPLTADQGGQLRDLLLANRADPKKGISTLNWDAARIQASAVLAPTQLAAFDAVRNRRDLNQAMNDLSNPPGSTP